MKRVSLTASRPIFALVSLVLASLVAFSATAAASAGRSEYHHEKHHASHRQGHYQHHRHHHHHQHHRHDRDRGAGRPGRYNTRAGPVEGKLNVHLVPHSHDDVGWLKTVDQYYVGSNNSIQVAAVQYILDTVVEQLALDPNRRFIQVEQAFFQRWWRRQPKSVRRVVKRLVKTGQLEFTNGGWCMHDEAATHYTDMVHQMSLGLRLVRQQFGRVPRVAWQIDPFGHSAVQGYLISAMGGFDAVFFARADYEDSEQRYRERTAEFVWRASETLGERAQVFGGRLYRHYLPPDSFRYDTNNWDPPVQDDPELFDYNVKERVDAFVAAALTQAESYRTNHVMWTMGDDFAYGNALTWYSNMDKLIHYVNLDGRVNAFYSTPSIYLDAKHRANETWPLKTGDFFPYADCPHCYWTGYFSSRPAFKRYVRECSALLLAARQVEALVGRSRLGGRGQRADVAEGATVAAGAEASAGWRLGELEEAMAIAQHHDSVSGTAKQHVNDDYTLRLYRGAVKASSVLTGAIRAMILRQSRADTWQFLSLLEQTPDSPSGSSSSTSRPNSPLTRALEERSRRSGWRAVAADGGRLGLEFEMCPLSNISFCPPSQTDLENGKVLVVAVYNPLAWARKEIVRFPVSTADVEVMNASGAIIPSQVLPNTLLPSDTRSFLIQAYAGPDAEPSGRPTSASPAEPDAAAGAEPGGAGSEALSLVFWADAPPLGVASFFVLYNYPEPEDNGEESNSEGAGQEGVVLDGSAADGRVMPKEEEGDEIVIGGWVEQEESEGSSSSALRLSFSRSQGGRMTGAVLMRRGEEQGGADGGGVPAGAAAATEAAAGPVSIDWVWYNASDGKASREASGAYIFRPVSSDPVPIVPPNATAASLRVVRGPLVDEVHRQVAPWIKEIVRVYKGTNYAEMEYAVGPVPIEEGFGKEVVVRFSSALNSGSSFYTDSNGRDFLKRIRNYRSDWNLTVTEPAAGNYYPVNSGIYLTDNSTDLSVLVDRASGASSLADGQLEAMLHRRLLHDDHRGVDEALNERVCVQGGEGVEGRGAGAAEEPTCMGLVVAGKLRFGLHPHASSAKGAQGLGEKGGAVVEAAAEWRRENIQRIFSPLQMAFAVENEEDVASKAGLYTWHSAGTQESEPLESTEATEEIGAMGHGGQGHGGQGRRVMKGGCGGVEEEREVEAEVEEEEEVLDEILRYKEEAVDGEEREEGEEEDGEVEEAERSEEDGVVISSAAMEKRAAYELPKNVAIITLQELHPYKVLLRLAHLYEANEDPILSQPALVNLDRLFAHQEIEKVTELSLMANQKLLEVRAPMEWRIEEAASGSAADAVGKEVAGESMRERGLELRDGPFIVELGPMEIRTFAIHFDD